jgi:hypothetical protein
VTVELLLAFVALVGLAGAATIAHYGRRGRGRRRVARRFRRATWVDDAYADHYRRAAEVDDTVAIRRQLHAAGSAEVPPMRRGGVDRPFDWRIDDPQWAP